eukprot:Pgem_evm1s16257
MDVDDKCIEMRPSPLFSGLNASELFSFTLDVLLNRWTTLCMAIDHCFGGQDSE